MLLYVDTCNQLITDAVVTDVVARYPANFKPFQTLRSSSGTHFHGDVDVLVRNECY